MKTFRRMLLTVSSPASSRSMSRIIIRPLSRRDPNTTPTHHVGNPPTAFKNPWPSANRQAPSLMSLLSMRMGWGDNKKNFVPIPESRDELVTIRTPDWGADMPDSLRATWFGHASFLVETPVQDAADRGVRILLDPVFGDHMGPKLPVIKPGPKRFSPLPCQLEDVPKVDLVLISHSHYDHLDVDVVKDLYAGRGRNIHFFCGLNLKKWFVSCGIDEGDVTEMDWWDETEVEIPKIGKVKLICTPAQHSSARTATDRDHTLWCSWTIQEPKTGKKLFFAGDTGYRVMTQEDLDKDEKTLPHCPAFAEIGVKYGPIDLALLPIGCFLPRPFMSLVHSAPEDSVCIHQDIRSRKTIGMHYGTIRGNLSGQYEEVTLPPRRFEEKAKEAGLKWGDEIGLCDIGESVTV